MLHAIIQCTDMLTIDWSHSHTSKWPTFYIWVHNLLKIYSNCYKWPCTYIILYHSVERMMTHIVRSVHGTTLLLHQHIIPKSYLLVLIMIDRGVNSEPVLGYWAITRNRLRNQVPQLPEGYTVTQVKPVIQTR